MSGQPAPHTMAHVVIRAGKGRASLGFGCVPGGPGAAGRARHPDVDGRQGRIGGGGWLLG
jgi:hypothetical protein